MDLTRLKSAVEVSQGDFLARLEERATQLPRPSDHRVRDDGVVTLAKTATSGGAILRAPADAQGPPTKISPEEGRKMAEARGIGWTDEFVDRFVSYWMSDERVDSHGDIVLQEWDFGGFRKNAVMPFNHNWSGAPVGYMVQEGVADRKDRGYSGRALWGTGLFATRSMFEWADTVFRLVKSGFLKAGSVGFISHKVIDIKDEEERAALGLGRYGFILDKNELLEFSPTLLGANKGAISVLAQAKGKGLLEPRDFDLIRELSRLENHHDPDSWRKDDGTLVSCARFLFPGSKHKSAVDVDQPIVDFAAGDEDAPAEPPASMEAAMENLANRFDAGLSEIIQIMSDIRDMLEVRHDTEEGDSKDTDTGGDGDNSDGSRALRESIARLDARVAAAFTA